MLLLAVLAVSVYGAVEIIRIPFLNIPATPADYGLDYERVQFPSIRGVELTGWWIPADKASPVAVIVQHGIGSNAGDMLPSSLCLRNDGAWNLFYYNFRGHGDSGGRQHTSPGRSSWKTCAARSSSCANAGRQPAAGRLWPFARRGGRHRRRGGDAR